MICLLVSVAYMCNEEGIEQKSNTANCIML